jgi:hypothetical protein
VARADRGTVEWDSSGWTLFVLDSRVKAMKVLVTGAAGFIGASASLHFAQRGHSVVGLDNFNDYYDVRAKNANAMDLLGSGDRCPSTRCLR